MAQEIRAENLVMDTGVRLLPTPIQLNRLPLKCKGNPSHIRVRHFPHPAVIRYRGAHYPDFTFKVTVKCMAAKEILYKITKLTVMNVMSTKSWTFMIEVMLKLIVVEC